MRLEWSRRSVIAAGAVGLASAVAVASMFMRQQWVVRLLSMQAPDVLLSVTTEARIIALTIDDSPHPESTRAILDVLKRHGARATFFIIGRQVRGNENVVREIVESGHELGNHMYEDRAAIRLSDRHFREQLRTTHEILRKYSSPTLFRPGSGAFDETIVRIASEEGYTTVLGSIYPFDPQLPFESYLKRQLLMNVRPGAIVILHDRGPRGARTARVLDAVLPKMKERGYTVTTVSDLVSRSGSSGN